MAGVKRAEWVVCHSLAFGAPGVKAWETSQRTFGVVPVVGSAWDRLCGVARTIAGGGEGVWSRLGKTIRRLRAICGVGLLFM
jgi:hypothetical protein